MFAAAQVIGALAEVFLFFSALSDNKEKLLQNRAIYLVCIAVTCIFLKGFAGVCLACISLGCYVVSEVKAGSVVVLVVYLVGLPFVVVKDVFGIFVWLGGILFALTINKSTELIKVKSTMAIGCLLCMIYFVRIKMYPSLFSLVILVIVMQEVAFKSSGKKGRIFKLIFAGKKKLKETKIAGYITDKHPEKSDKYNNDEFIEDMQVDDIELDEGISADDLEEEIITEEIDLSESGFSEDDFDLFN